MWDTENKGRNTRKKVKRNFQNGDKGPMGTGSKQV